jgi:glutamate synthase (NADPH/NADH) small chain
MTKNFSGHETRVGELHCCQVEWIRMGDNWRIRELPGTNFVIKADLVLLAMGFLYVEHESLVKQLGLQLDERGNVAVKNFQSSEPWVFAAGDTVSGASLVASAINSGREAAAAIDQWLTKKGNPPIRVAD